jgi:transcriptional regulator with XRE-family HTH domain
MPKPKFAVSEGLKGSHELIGQGIRRKRQEAGLSLAAVAKEVGLAVSTMSKIETGKISTTFERLDAIGRALGADLAEFLQEEGGIKKESVIPTLPHGTRRSITRGGEGGHVDAGRYLNVYHAIDLLHKKGQPLFAEVLVDNLDDFGRFVSHPGEEYNYIIEGELEFHTKVYQPVLLRAGDSIYFDAEMDHAHIKVGVNPCRLVAVLMPRHDGDGAEHLNINVTRRADG